MARKPATAVHYTPRDVALVRRACLSLATYLGSFRDDLVVVGGLVPGLLVEPDERRELHVGTQDLDLGLSLAVLEESRYVELVAHLRSARFEPDVTAQGRAANHRWRHLDERITVDFLIAPTESSVQAKVRVIDSNLSAVLAVGLPLAFRDRRKISLAGTTLRGEVAARDIWVCGAGAFVVLKALAFRGRGENKDAYDLLYVLENFGREYVAEVAAALRPLLDSEATQEALSILRDDFSAANRPGPMRAAEFLGRSADAGFVADRAGAVAELLRILER